LWEKFCFLNSLFLFAAFSILPFSLSWLNHPPLLQREYHIFLIFFLFVQSHPFA
jgi:hypothetical protein